MFLRTEYPAVDKLVAQAQPQPGSVQNFTKHFLKYFLFFSYDEYFFLRIQLLRMKRIVRVLYFLMKYQYYERARRIY